MEILDEEFTIDSVRGGPSIPVTVPEGLAGLFLALDYREGAYKDAAFSLGECKGVAPVNGTAVSAGATVQVAGSTSRDVLYPCGVLPPGRQEVTWSIANGILTGRITLYADVPNDSQS